VMGLLVLVALGSRGGIPWDRAEAGDGSSADALRFLALLILGAATLAAVVALFFSWRRRRHDRERDGLVEEAGPGDWRERLARAALAYLLAAVVVLVLLVGADGIDRLVPDGGTGGGPADRDAPPSGTPARGVPSLPFGASWILVGALLLLALAASTSALRPLRRRVRPPSAEALEAVRGTTLAGVVDETLDDLYREPDPRRAVIAAYARMERGLAARGIPRRPSDAPLEYLARVLVAGRADARFVRRLTELFQRAAFSRAEVDAAEKEEAIGCLVAIRSSVRPPD
jgi:hypothetical protein